MKTLRDIRVASGHSPRRIATAVGTVVRSVKSFELSGGRLADPCVRRRLAEHYAYLRDVAEMADASKGGAP